MAQKMIDPNEASNLTLAYIGDSFYELTLRIYALNANNGSVNDINKFAKRYSCATMQAKMIELLLDELSEKEERIYKRGRNAKSVTAPKSCSISEYRRATGLEALMGYLYLSGDTDRAEQLVELGIARVNEIKAD